MVIGSTSEEAERRRPVEEPVAAPVTNPAWKEEWLRTIRTEKEITAAEVPAAAPVSVPAPVTVPRTPDGTWRVREADPQGGGPRRGYSPMDRYFGGFHGNRKDRERRAPLRRGSWNGRKTPPSWIKVVLVY